MPLLKNLKAKKQVVLAKIFLMKQDKGPARESGH